MSQEEREALRRQALLDREKAADQVRDLEFAIGELAEAWTAACEGVLCAENVHEALAAAERAPDPTRLSQYAQQLPGWRERLAKLEAYLEKKNGA